jgi:hypothetical protein
MAKQNIQNFPSQADIPTNSDALRKTAYDVGMTEDDKEDNYGKKYQDMVTRVGQKAREQEKNKPVNIADLARRLAAIEASKKDK